MAKVVFSPAMDQQTHLVIAQRRMLEGMKAFNEIMTSGNPLTKDEIKKLYEKRPEWSFLTKWL